MPKCVECSFEGPKECFYFIEGKFVCICCDFEAFLGEYKHSDRADQIIGVMLEDMYKKSLRMN